MAFPSVTTAADPLGYQLYRLGHPDEFPAAGPTVIPWSSSVERDILSVDRRVNTSMRPQREHPREDRWRADVRFGDCEDFALTKRRALIRLGYPPRALRIRIVSRVATDDHVVLEVVTSRGRVTLDVPRSQR